MNIGVGDLNLFTSPNGYKEGRVCAEIQHLADSDVHFVPTRRGMRTKKAVRRCDLRCCSSQVSWQQDLQAAKYVFGGFIN